VGTSGDASLADIDSYQLLDLALSKTIANGNGELMVGVSDVLNRSNEPIFETTTNANYKTPGRTFFGRVQFNF
jgi:hypothetical protein